jgi:heme a synthase
MMQAYLTRHAQTSSPKPPQGPPLMTEIAPTVTSEPGLQPARSSRAQTGSDLPAIRLWLWLVVALIFCIVIVGGATRLTDSGLSITEWHPVTGILPPLSEAAWLAELEKYRGTTEYELINKGFGLADFKAIYWWEWGHRLLGRVIGLVMLGGLAVFALRRALPPGLLPKLLAITALIGLQGFVGWWMVRSGLVGRVDVAPYRLATHLSLACLILALAVWTVMSLRASRLGNVSRASAVTALALLAFTLVQVFLGALVAGNKAGLVYNTWPLMDGALLPRAEDYLFISPAWRNLFETHFTVQFNHRVMAYLLLILAFWHAFALKRAGAPEPAQSTGRVVALLMLGQAALGILTLLLVAPVALALAHQAYAALLLIMVTIHAQRLFAASPDATASRTMLPSPEWERGRG